MFWPWKPLLYTPMGWLPGQKRVIADHFSGFSWHQIWEFPPGFPGVLHEKDWDEIWKIHQDLHQPFRQAVFPPRRRTHIDLQNPILPHRFYKCGEPNTPQYFLPFCRSKSLQNHQDPCLCGPWMAHEDQTNSSTRRNGRYAQYRSL